jgi:hypothetical protein
MGWRNDKRSNKSKQNNEADYSPDEAGIKPDFIAPVGLRGFGLFGYGDIIHLLSEQIKTIAINRVEKNMADISR